MSNPFDEKGGKIHGDFARTVLEFPRRKAFGMPIGVPDVVVGTTVAVLAVAAIVLFLNL